MQKPVKTQRIMELRPYTSIKAKTLLNMSGIPCYLVNKRRENAFDINGSPRYLNIVTDFHEYVIFSLCLQAWTMYSSEMVIEYSLPRISPISSYIITHKALILSLFWKRRSSYFPAKKNPHVVGKTDINTAIVETWKFWI